MTVSPQNINVCKYGTFFIVSYSLNVWWSVFFLFLILILTLESNETLKEHTEVSIFYLIGKGYLHMLYAYKCAIPNNSMRQVHFLSFIPKQNTVFCNHWLQEVKKDVFY